MPQPVDPIAFLRGLRATRQFSDRPVPDDALADILEIARWTGSSMNKQPWRIVVVQDRAMLEQLGAIGTYTRHIADAPLGLFLVMDGDDLETEAYDDGRLSERIMLAADAHGLGSCIGWFWEEGHSPAVKEALGVPQERTLRTAISIGYPAVEAGSGDRPASGRKALEEIVDRERWSLPG
jgi:nitroreductase